LVNQSKTSNDSFAKKAEYSNRLEIWRTANEDNTKMSITDFFERPDFEFISIQNFLGLNMFEKTILFMERHGKFNIYQIDPLRPVKHQIANFETGQTEIEEVV
jgi:hypothetical protein